MATWIQMILPKKKWRRYILGCFIAFSIAGLMCAGLCLWLSMPRVKVADVEELVASSISAGTTRKVVEDWLKGRSMVILGSKNEIESWIPDTGPLAEFPFGIRDIQIRFFFDGDERLSIFTVKEESRF
jgi:hypothetical protein